MIAPEHESRFDLFGSRVRLLIGSPLRSDLPTPEVAAIQVEAFLRAAHRQLTRFEPTSELSALNRDPRERVEVSTLLALAVRAGTFAAEESGGLVDPTLLGELESAGYDRSRVGVAPASLIDAIATAPPRRPASPRADSAWRRIDVDIEGGLVKRPPGTRLDTGGTGKGLAADLASARLAGYEMHVVDAGGDLRIGGERPEPRVVEIADPFSGRPAFTFELSRGAVATSGLDTRIWSGAGGFAHHLLDPSTGKPAWTGVVQATAVAETALRAETLAKAALLSGPDRGLALLSARGGFLVLDEGEIRAAGPLAEHGHSPVVESATA